MSHDALLQTLRRLALPAARSQGLDVWGIEIVGEGRPTLRVFVEARAPEPAADAPGEGEGPEAPARLSATVGQCEAVSRQLSLALDAEEVLDSACVLEVSTPGFCRIFFEPGQMRPYVGDMVEARLSSPWSPGEGLPARRTWKGVLKEVSEDGFVLEPATVGEDGETARENLPPAAIPFGMTRRVSRIHVFRRPPRPGRGRKTDKGGQAGRAARNAS